MNLTWRMNWTLKTLFLRILHPGISHHLGVLACLRTMNTQQLRDLVQKAYGKQRWPPKRVPKPQQFLNSILKVTRLALSAPNAKTAPSRHTESWMHPRPQRMRLTHWHEKKKDRKLGKKEKPDSAWLVVGREGNDKLIQSATENSTPSPLTLREH